MGTADALSDNHTEVNARRAVTGQNGFFDMLFIMMRSAGVINKKGREGMPTSLPWYRKKTKT